jgi:hypothetical protein
MRRAAAVASLQVASDAASALLAKGNAVDAVVAGVLAAAGAHDSVLLGPVQLLVGGAGAGLRAIDGRTRQPGKGAARPRGFQPEDDVPKAARVAVPALPAALAAALASFGKSSAAAVFAPGIEAARGAPERKRLLERLARRGPSALSEEAIARELVAAGGRLAGGVLTEDDLADVRPETAACAIESVGERRAARAPWRSGVRSGRVHAVAAADSRGVLAVACFEVTDEGVLVEGLGLVAPLLAEPVLRGTTRVRPGEARPAAVGNATRDRGARPGRRPNGRRHRPRRRAARPRRNCLKLYSVTPCRLAYAMRPILSIVRMSRVVRFNVTNFLSSGTQRRRVWMFRFCQRFVLMFECETFCAFSLRLPVMSLLAMTERAP